jgi:DNA-binding response OmpR family regulator
MQQLEPAQPMTEQRPARILVIDDEITQRMLVKEYLEEAGYVVRLSDDGRRGLKMAAATNPDLIILDLMLPSMDGYTLCTCLKQADSTAHIPIILVTAAREPGVIERGLAAGADDFVTKPVDWAFLADRVRFVLARAKEQQFAAAVAAPAGASAPRTESAADKARLEEAAATAEAARAELSMLKEQIGAERQRSDLQHRTALDAARAELAALKEAAAADRAKSGEQHNAALDAARAGIEARARLEIDALKARHNDELAAVRALAARDQDTLRAALKPRSLAPSNDMPVSWLHCVSRPRA